MAMTAEQKIDAIQGVMDSAALIGSILISSDNRDELTSSLAMSALSVIDEILSDDAEFGELA
jgi:hypothetical protein